MSKRNYDSKNALKKIKQDINKIIDKNNDLQINKITNLENIIIQTQKETNKNLESISENLKQLTELMLNQKKKSNQYPKNKIKSRAKSQNPKSKLNINKKSSNLEIENDNNKDNINDKLSNEKEKGKKEEDNIIDNTDLQNLIKSKIYYIEYITDEKEYYKFSFSKPHWNTLNISYKCSDSICGSRLSANFELLNNNIINLVHYEIKKNHTIKNEEHNYNYDKNILEDIKNTGTLVIKKKCSNPIYFKKFLILMYIKENRYNLKGKEILLKFKNIYGDIKFKIDDISDNYKQYIIKKYNLNINIKDFTNKIFNDNITPDIIANSVASYIYNLNHKKLVLDQQLKNIGYIKENISYILYIKFTRHDIIYNKKGYIYITESMKKKLINNNNKHSQFFADCTYNVIPSQIKNFKLYVLIAFNNEKNITELCAFALISNENIETFESIYHYLYNNYKFQPKKMTVDC